MMPHDPHNAFQKALILQKRLPEIEPLILQYFYYSYHYANDIIKGRWEEAETTIATNASYSYLYAKNLLRGKFAEAEPIILQNAPYAYAYAKDALKWRIKGNKEFYISLIPTLWYKFPKRVKNSPDIMTAYFKEIILK
jgi:hypothetical protein